MHKHRKRGSMIDQEITTPEEALETALILAIEAPDREHQRQAVILAGIVIQSFNIDPETVVGVQRKIEARIAAGEELL